MPKLTMTVPVTVYFLYYEGDIEIKSTELPTEEDLEEWLWEAKDEWEED